MRLGPLSFRRIHGAPAAGTALMIIMLLSSQQAVAGTVPVSSGLARLSNGVNDRNHPPR